MTAIDIDNEVEVTEKLPDSEHAIFLKREYGVVPFFRIDGDLIRVLTDTDTDGKISSAYAQTAIDQWVDKMDEAKKERHVAFILSTREAHFSTLAPKSKHFSIRVITLMVFWLFPIITIAWCCITQVNSGHPLPMPIYNLFMGLAFPC